MDEATAIIRMIAPGQRRETKWRQGVIQITVTSACDKACYNCTQGSNLQRKPWFMTPEQFEAACLSLKGYWGVVGTFGGNPAVSKYFGEYCRILRSHFPKERCGLWCNNPLGWGKEMRETYNPHYSNLNVHLDKTAFNEFKRDWPESMPFGLHEDSRHSPPFVAMKDIIGDEGKRWELISNCDINKFWSAAISVFRGELRAYFCELASSQAMLHQYEEDYPDTGLDPTRNYEHHVAPGERIETTIGKWWQLPMSHFTDQVHKHCHECSVPLQGYGELAQADKDPGETITHVEGLTPTREPEPKEQTSAIHASIYKPKRAGRKVEIVTHLEQLGIGRLENMTRYLQNAKK